MQSTTNERAMQARFSGTCRVCGGPIEEGDSIFYSKANGTRHADAKACASAKDAPAAPAFAPTSEQVEGLRLFGTGKSLAIEAGAGAGKTSELKLLAQSTNRRGQYIAFNKAIVEESKAKMPRTVNASTAHSLAYRNTVARNKWMADRLRRSARMKSLEIAARLGIEAQTVTLQDGTTKKLHASYLAGVVMRGVTRFCQSADAQPEAHHVPYLDGIDLPPGAKDNNRQVAKSLVKPMRKAWADIIDPHGSLPFKHDHYLKLWHLSGPKIDAEYILFDEAQDANPVLVDIIKQQTHAQLVWVGDSQQAIYAFTGAVNALQQVDAEQRAFLSQSFRFGPAIAEVANGILELLNAELELTGTESIPSRVEALAEPQVILSRTNATAVRYALDALKDGKQPHIVGGGREIVDFAKAAQSLMAGEGTEHPELACFATWGEVQNYVEQDEQGGELRLLVSLIDEFGVDTILEALDGMIDERDADLILSTAHKAKGREWDTVQLADDFPAEPTGDDELRLLYVAVTRAKLVLDVTACKMLNGGYAAGEAPAEEERAPSTEPITPAARAAVERLLDAPARVPVGQLAREFTRDEIKCLMDYVATTDHETYSVSRLADGHLYVEKPGGSMYRLSPLEEASRS